MSDNLVKLECLGCGAPIYYEDIKGIFCDCEYCGRRYAVPMIMRDDSIDTFEEDTKPIVVSGTSSKTIYATSCIRGFNGTTHRYEE